MKADWKRIHVVLALVFLVPAVLLVPEKVESARMIFVALSWTFSVFAITLVLIPEKKMWRNVIRVLSIPLLAPLAVIFVFAGGDALMDWFSSDAANQSAHVVQCSYGEMIKIPSIIKKMMVSGDLRQFNGNFNWFFLAIGFAFVASAIKLLWIGICSISKKKDRELAGA